MSRLRRHEDIGINAYLNFALTLAKALMVLLLASFALMASNDQISDGIKPSAEYTIEMSWEDGSPHDIDLWMELPSKQLIYYQQKELSLANLDRDDTGSNGNSILVDGKIYRSLLRKEIIALRGIIPGEYVVNVMLFSFSGQDSRLTEKTRKSYQTGDDLPVEIPVLVEIKKLNPVTQIVFNSKVVIRKNRQEIHIVRFVLDKDGTVTNITTNNPISLANKVVPGATLFEGRSR